MKSSNCAENAEPCDQKSIKALKSICIYLRTTFRNANVTDRHTDRQTSEFVFVMTNDKCVECFCGLCLVSAGLLSVCLLSCIFQCEPTWMALYRLCWRAVFGCAVPVTNLLTHSRQWQMTIEVK